MGGGGECWCWGALEPLNLGEGRSACLASLGVYPERRAVAWWHLLQGSETPGEEGGAELALPDFAGSGLGPEGPGVSQEPGEPGLRMEQRQAFTTVGEGSGRGAPPSLSSLLRMVGVGWARGEGGI